MLCLTGVGGATHVCPPFKSRSNTQTYTFTMSHFLTQFLFRPLLESMLSHLCHPLIHNEGVFVEALMVERLLCLQLSCTNHACGFSGLVTHRS